LAVFGKEFYFKECPKERRKKQKEPVERLECTLMAAGDYYDD